MARASAEYECLPVTNILEVAMYFQYPCWQFSSISYLRNAASPIQDVFMQVLGHIVMGGGDDIITELATIAKCHWLIFLEGQGAFIKVATTTLQQKNQFRALASGPRTEPELSTRDSRSTSAPPHTLLSYRQTAGVSW